MSTKNHNHQTNRARCVRISSTPPLPDQWERYATHLEGILDASQRIADVCFWISFTALVFSSGIDMPGLVRILLAVVTLGFLAIASTLYDRR
jgi:hypothetical protein